MVVVPVSFALATVAAALGAVACRFDIEILPECASSNDELLARAGRGAPSGSVVVVERQTAGRGRLGRPWLAGPGESLTFSVLWRFAAGTSLAGLPLAVGVAVARALEGAGVKGIALKWPNDVLKDGRKLAGILIELHAPTVAVIGVGLNLRLPAAMPPALRATAAALDEAGAADAPGGDVALVDNPGAALAAVLQQLAGVLDTFAIAGFAPLRDDWRARHAWAGRPVCVHSPHAVSQDGICVDIDDDGALLLQTAQGQRRILSGDVSLRLR